MLVYSSAIDLSSSHLRHLARHLTAPDDLLRQFLPDLFRRFRVRS
ncbi:hypothetical protein [Streptomyces sp. NPDC055105]